MNVNIYLEDELAKQLDELAKITGRSRNMLIREAVRDWIKYHNTKQWPKAVLNFKGCKDMPPFESLRNELIAPKEDPFE